MEGQRETKKGKIQIYRVRLICGKLHHAGWHHGDRGLDRETDEAEGGTGEEGSDSDAASEESQEVEEQIINFEQKSHELLFSSSFSHVYFWEAGHGGTFFFRLPDPPLDPEAISVS